MRALSIVVVATIFATWSLTALTGLSARQTACDERQKQWFQQPDPKDWNTLYRLFKDSAQCDDGAMAEGFSEDVAQLLRQQGISRTGIELVQAFFPHLAIFVMSDGISREILRRAASNAGQMSLSLLK